MKKIVLLCSAVLFLLGSCNMPSDNAGCIDTAKKFDEAWNSGNAQSILSFFADDAVVTLMPPPPDKATYTGKKEIEEFANKLLPGFHVESTHYRTEGNKVSWEFTVR